MGYWNMGKFFLRKSVMFVSFFILTLGSVQMIYAKDMDFNKSKTVTIQDNEAYPVTKSFQWVKYKAPADGYISLKASFASLEGTYSAGEWTLYDKSKLMALSEKNIVYSTKGKEDLGWRTSIFGVKKGSTYYLRVRAYNGVKITCTFKKINEKSGKTRLFAVNLKKGKAVTGLISADLNTADWYKIKLKEKKRVNLYFKIMTTGSFRISLYSGLGRGLTYKDLSYSAKEQRIKIEQKNSFTGKTSGVPAGTYYIKIDKSDGTSSGYYTLRWK